MKERAIVSPEEAERLRRMKSRNRALLIALLGVAGLFYLLTFVRMGGQ